MTELGMVVAQDAAQEIRTGGVYRLENENMEVIRDAVQSVVAGAYAAAAKHFPYFGYNKWESCHCGWTATYTAPLAYSQKEFIEQFKQHILALTPADARQARCQGCGGPHPFDTSVPSEKWNVVIRAKNLPEFLCLTCIVREFVKAGQDFTAELWGESFNGAPIAVSNNPAAIISAEARARQLGRQDGLEAGITLCEDLEKKWAGRGGDDKIAGQFHNAAYQLKLLHISTAARTPDSTDVK